MGTLKDIDYGVGKYLEASDASDIPGIGNNRKNLDLLNFKVATNNAYTLYKFKDGFIDAYQDQTGVDIATSTGENYDNTNKFYTSQQSLVENNYSYTGSTTTLAVVTGTTYTIKTWGAGGGNGAQNEGGWLAGAAGGFSTGTYSFGTNTTLVISAGGAGLKGNQSASGGFGGGGPRGPFYNNTSGGANGGGYSGVFVGSVAHANTLQMAGGGGGGYYYGPHGGAVAGGGGGSSGTNSAGGSSGGTQSAGGTQSGGGSGSALQGGTGGNGSDGIGGAGGGGGYYGGAGSGGYNNGGGSGGGGSGFVATTATINSIAVTAESTGATTASVGTSMNGTGSGDSKYPGGGIGNEQTNGAAYISYTPASAMTLISNTQTAQTNPTLGRLMLYEEDIDSITLDTDIKGYVSRDGGTTYTQTPLAEDVVYQEDTNIKLLMHMDGANDGTVFTDSSLDGLTVTKAGTPVTKTAEKVFGTASCYLAGTTDWLKLPASDNWSFDAGQDFTVECWCKWSTAASYVGMISSKTEISSVYNGWSLRTDSSGANRNLSFNFWDNAGSVTFSCNGTSNIGDGSWHHVAATRASDTVRVFVDGVLENSGTYAGAIHGTSSGGYGLQIGMDYLQSTGSGPMHGYVDEVRIVRGVAKYTASFTEPTSAFTLEPQRILSGSVDISGQPAGSNMKYKVETLNNKNLKLHGASLLWA